MNNLAPHDDELPRFLRVLYTMVDDTDCDYVIRWGHMGTAIEIVNVQAMSDVVLPKYFSHQKFTSFQRQLNYFGFRKWTKTQTDICTFSHPDFLQYDQQRAHMIRRGKRCTSSPRTVPCTPRSAVSTPSWSSLEPKKVAPKSTTVGRMAVKRSLSEIEMPVMKKMKETPVESPLVLDDDEAQYKQILDFLMDIPASDWLDLPVEGTDTDSLDSLLQPEEDIFSFKNIPVIEPISLPSTSIDWKLVLGSATFPTAC